MKLLSIKPKALIIAVTLILLGTAAFSGTEIRETFTSGSRNLPVYNVERSDTKLALTFNCAWNDTDIDQILAHLEKYGAKCTFFVVGDWAEKYPDAVKKIHQSGHEIGQHSYSHKDYTLLNKEQIQEDIAKTTAVIKDLTGTVPNLVRVPSGAYNNSAITAIENYGYIPVQWSVDSIDYGNSSCEEIFSRVCEKAAAGDIILMHNGTKNTAAALPRILDSLSGKYELVKVSDLLYNDNFYVDSTGKMKLK